jgi:tetratricopeptide (TPR) repeat protein
MRRVAQVLILVLWATGGALAASSGGGGSQSASEDGRSKKQVEAEEIYGRGMELVEAGDFHGALDRFEKAHKKDKKNPEYLNMMAYSQRKLGNLEDAFETYHRVLGLDPDFAPAREYLGEAHLQALLHQIDLLRGYGDEARAEYDALVAALQEAANTLTAGEPEGATPVPDKKPW